MANPPGPKHTILTPLLAFLAPHPFDFFFDFGAEPLCVGQDPRAFRCRVRHTSRRILISAQTCLLGSQ